MKEIFSEHTPQQILVWLSCVCAEIPIVLPTDVWCVEQCVQLIALVLACFFAARCTVCAHLML